MKLFPIKPRLSLNKAFLKVKPNRSSIELFKSNLIRLLDRIDEIEREIDKLVYALYGLTDEEIKIVEGE